VPLQIPLRGVIEGFYGPPWTHTARLHAIDFLASRGMNAYVYAPKDEPKHRERWRDAYDRDELACFEGLADGCRAVGTRFGFAISPGLDIGYSDTDDRAALLAKLAPLVDTGVDWFVLALDDIPARPGLAPEQADLTRWLQDRLGGELRLSLVPTEYVGTRPSPYLAELADALPPDVDVMWTGPTVCSPVITAADAEHWRAALGGRSLLLWDNYPVNDTIMERELHLGAYRGREPELAQVVDGVLCNPMLQPQASLVALATAAEFLADPQTYDERDAWERAIVDVGGDNATTLRALARACADGPLAGPETLPASELMTKLTRAVDGAAWAEPMTALRAELDPLRGAAHRWDGSVDSLGDEVRPWLEQATREADASAAALRLIQQVRPVALRHADGSGRAAAPDADAALLHCFAVLYAWSGARDASRSVVFGPRYALHPAVIQLSDGRQGLDVALTVREDRCVTDSLCRLALDQYARWARAPCSDLDVTTDDGDVAVSTDGVFRAAPDLVVTVHSGDHDTSVPAGSAPPFSDSRLRSA